MHSVTFCNSPQCHYKMHSLALYCELSTIITYSKINKYTCYNLYTVFLLVCGSICENAAHYIKKPQPKFRAQLYNIQVLNAAKEPSLLAKFINGTFRTHELSSHHSITAVVLNVCIHLSHKSCFQFYLDIVINVLCGSSLFASR